MKFIYVLFFSLSFYSFGPVFFFFSSLQINVKHVCALRMHRSLVGLADVPIADNQYNTRRCVTCARPKIHIDAARNLCLALPGKYPFVSHFTFTDKQSFFFLPLLLQLLLMIKNNRYRMDAPQITNNRQRLFHNSITSCRLRNNERRNCMQFDQKKRMNCCCVHVIYAIVQPLTVDEMESIPTPTDLHLRMKKKIARNQ